MADRATATSSFDPRLTPARPDLAAKHLEGKVAAARFVEGEVARGRRRRRRRCGASPSPDAPLDTEALKGERVTVYETTEEGWAWGQLEADGYVGWLPADALRAPGPAPTHKVAALRTFVFPGPSIKLPPVEALSLRLPDRDRAHRRAVRGDDVGRLCRRRGISRRSTRSEDRFGRGRRAIPGRALSLGRQDQLRLDCSGLVQIALNACGIACPRDSDMQERALGAAVRPDGLGSLRRGDLVFWQGHVAIVRDAADAHSRQRLSHGGRDRADRAKRSRASAPPAAR